MTKIDTHKEIEIFESGNIEQFVSIYLKAKTKTPIHFSSLQISIPIQTRSLLFVERNRKLEKPILTFLMLKAIPFRESGIIHHKQKQLPIIAKHLNMSYQTIMRHIAVLKKIGLVEKLSKNTLRLASYNNMLDTLEGKKEPKRSFKKQVYSLEKFAQNPFKEMEHLFLHELQKNQSFAIRKKIRKSLAESKIKCSAISMYAKRNNSSIIDDCEKFIKYGLNQEKLSYLLSNSELAKLKSIDVENCISCFGLANYFNRKSARTGSLHLRKLDIERKNRKKLISNKKVSVRELFYFRERYLGFFFLMNGFLYQKLSSTYSIDVNVGYKRKSNICI